VAVLVNPTNPAAPGYIAGLLDAAPKFNAKVQPYEIRDPGEFNAAFATIIAAHNQAMIVVPDPVTVRYRAQIVEFAARHRLPSVYGFREFVDAGGLISYGVNIPRLCHRAAYYVDKILKGAKPADLPIEQSTVFELVINRNTAKALGLTIPPSLLLRADQVIE
jgi:putative ABC transport system substrate-binding protein